MTITPRSAWSDYPRTFQGMKRPVDKVYVHHSADPAAPASSEMLQLDAIERYHMQSRGYLAIGYSFVVFPSGNAYEGRGWNAVGAHTEGHNSEGYGICFAGNFQTDEPTSAALLSACFLIADGISRGFLTRTPAVIGHRDTKATACPGNNLYARLNEITPKEQSVPDTKPQYPVVSPVAGIAATPKGYIIVTTTGEIITFGDAEYHGRVVVKS